ncbi:MAG: alpha-glucosidase [Clostridia bacterium]|nr:alpha-glucosidase [Clostridia bacterium]
MKQLDYRRMAFYQIWIRSFADGNGDGIGDLYGVYNKLEYIRDLGVDGIWFSPIYPSPNADYGYDIADYRNIHPEYGTLEQFQKVLHKAHELGLAVIMDLVVNHTSDEHPWFLESRKGKDNPYSDYYIWRDPKPSKKGLRPPNNWFSQFEGLAWEYDAGRGQYYLHVFAKKQPDLNMDNPRVREEVKDIMRFWLEMGVDGFREDVITYISKHEKLPDGIPFLPAINGLPFYKDGPNLMQYLREFRAVAQEYGAVQIGEAPMTSVKTALRYLVGKDRVLDMMIQFDTMMADCIITEYMHHAFSLRKLKRAFSKWQTELAGKAWNALYLENHDHPRVISRYGSERYWRESGTALATAYLFQQGTPFIYQGQEIGMLNIALPSIDSYNDVASINMYRTFFRHQSEEKRMHRIHISSRDSARTPVQWDDTENAGFTTGTPWFHVNPNYRQINVAAEERDPDSILNFYRKALALRKSNDTLLFGTYREYQAWSNRRYVYERTYGSDRYLILISFSEREQRFRLPKGFDKNDLKLQLSNYPTGEAGVLRPYEAQVWHCC